MECTGVTASTTFATPELRRTGHTGCRRPARRESMCDVRQGLWTRLPVRVELAAPVALLLAGLTFGLCASAALADETRTINFETPVIPGTASPERGPAVSSQYLSEGVEFLPPSSSPVKHPLGFAEAEFEELYLYRDEANAHSGKQVLWGYAGDEFEGCSAGYAQIFGRLSTETTQLELYAGAQGGAPVELAGYNAKGEVVAHATAELETKDTTLLQIKSSPADIAYFSLAITDGGPCSTPALELDDLSFVVPAAPPPPAIVLEQSVLPSGPAGAQGTSASWTVAAQRFNKAEEAIELHVSGLPSGVVLSGGETIPKGSDSTALTFSISPSAPLVSDAPFTISASSPGVSPPAPIQADFSIEPPLRIELDLPGYGYGDSQIVALTPCSGTTAEVYVQPGRGTAPVPTSLALSASGDTGGLEYSLASPTVPSGGGPDSLRLSLSEAASGGFGAAVITVIGTRAGYPPASATVEVKREAGYVSSVLNTASSSTPTSVRTPALDAGGSQLTLKGAGFCPGTRVAIGGRENETNSEIKATPENEAGAESVGPDGNSLTFRVPPGARSGRIDVLSPNGQEKFSGPELTVRSFRNTYGFSWPNQDGMPLNQEMVDELFGKEETNVNVAGWLIRKPEADLFEEAVNKAIKGGLCFGMAYSSIEFFDLPGELAAFPSEGESDPWHLNSPSGPSPSLLRFVSERWALQDTENLIPAEVNAVIGVHGTNDDINEIKRGLAQGQPVLIAMLHWEGTSLTGHAVLAYETHPEPDGSTAVDVVNSNEPYLTKEEANAAEHDEREFTKSQIILKEGNWEFPQGAEFEHSGGVPWRGSEADMVVYKHSELPIINGQKPNLPNLADALGMVWFGSAGDRVTQLSDGHGSLFTGQQLAPQSSWPKAIAPIPAYTGHPAPLQSVSFEPKLSAPLTATVDRSAGGGAMNVNLPGLQASLQTGAHPGQIDHVTIDPHTDAIGYRTSAASTPLGGTLLAAPSATLDARAARRATSALSDRLVQFQTNAQHSGEEKLAFPAGREFLLDHSGSPTTVSLTLSAFGAGGRPIAVRLPAVRVASGETLRVAPQNWRALGSSSVRISATKHGHSDVHRLRGRRIGRRFATVRRAALEYLGRGRYRVDLALRLRHVPAHAWLSATATVLRGRRAVEQAKPIQLVGSALRAGASKLALTRSLPAGRYSLRIRLLEATANGPAQGSLIATRTLAVFARKR